MNEMNEPRQAARDDPAAAVRRRWLALYVLCLATLMIVLDTTIVNVALPSIRADLGFSETSLAWVVNAYLLTFGGFLLLGGRLGDLFGHRRLFLSGITLFTLASLCCGLANSQGLLVTARAVQGVGGAIASAVSLSLMMNLFTEPTDRAKAMGIFGFVASGGGSIGVLLGGILTELARLALDLPRQPSDRRARRRPLREAASRRSRARREPPARRRRGRHGDGGVDARRLRDRERQPGRLALRADARPARRVGSGTRDLPRHRVARLGAADAARAVPAPERRDGERGRRALGRRDVRVVLPVGALPAARARLQPAPGRARVPARAT